MKRRRFLRAAGTLGGAAVTTAPLATPKAAVAAGSPLAEHKIDAVELRRVRLPWPRDVGRNAVRGHHGNGSTAFVGILRTDQGALGWGIMQFAPNAPDDYGDFLIGQSLAELINPKEGVMNDTLLPFDLALHDLAGVVLGQPVWQMISGREGPILTKIYSGMIYFDDLDPEDSPAGIDKVLENCKWDWDYGYRQVKVKIGRGNKWMAPGAGLQRDIDVVWAIHDAFPDLEILVDGNNGFTPATMIQFLKGIGDVPLFWVEEPFHETVAEWRELAAWMKANGRAETYRADGEAKPDRAVLRELEADQTLNVCLTDICSSGFTPWRASVRYLEKQGIAASPHAWGSGLKTIYIAHLCGALGNHVTIEGVTSLEKNVDFGENRIVKGQMVPSSQPGFGISLKG